MKILRIAVAASLFCYLSFQAYELVSYSLIKQSLGLDYAETHDVKYGLFSINSWKRKLTRIIKKEISNFDISRNERSKIKPLIEEQLRKLIDNVYEEIKEKNQENFGGKLKQMFIDAVVDLKDIKEGVPGYAKEVLDLLEKKNNTKEVKTFLLGKVQGYLNKTFEKQDLSSIEEIMEKRQVKTIDEARDSIRSEMEILDKKIKMRTFTIIGLAFFIVLVLSGGILSTQRTELYPFHFHAALAFGMRYIYSYDYA